MRRCLALAIVALVFFSQVVMVSAEGLDEESLAALKGFFGAVTASVSEDDARVQAAPVGDGLRSLVTVPDKKTASAATATVQTYFPMQHGDSKSYTSNFGSSVYQYTQTSRNGQTAWRETDSLDGSQAYYGYSGSSLVMYGADASGLDFDFNTPLTILEENQLTNGGTLQSQTTLYYEGYFVQVRYTGTARQVGSVTVPAGTFDDCIELSMNFSYTAEGESESLELGDVWVLAPDVGKLKPAEPSKQPTLLRAIGVAYPPKRAVNI